VREQQEEWMELCKLASVEQNPEELFRLVCRINELLEAKDRRLRGATDLALNGKPVFQIAYDEKLLISRAELLKNRGYEIRSALGNESAKSVLQKQAQYRLFIVGHAAPRETRQEMVRWLRTNFPNTEILVLNDPSTVNLAEADYNVVLNGADEWLSIVANAA
jgi:CheY-like chemotaxis protein